MSMARLIIAVLIIGGLSIAAALVAEHPGVVIIDWDGWRVETSLAVLGVAAVALVVVAGMAQRAWLALRRSGTAIGEWRGSRARRLGYDALAEGILAVAAGDAPAAQIAARKTDKLLADHSLAPLLAAQAAQLGGDETSAERHFTRMLQRPETEFLGLRGLIDQAERAGDAARALALAERAARLRPDAPWPAQALIALQVKTGQWREAEAALAQAIKHKALGSGAGTRARAAVIMAQAEEAAKSGQNETALALAQSAAKLAPDFLPAALMQAEMFGQKGDKRKALKVLSRAWARTPHAGIAEAWRKIEDDLAPEAKLPAAEKFAGAHRAHPEGRLFLARAALDGGEYARARSELEQIGALGRRGLRLMAELDERQYGDQAGGHQWLERAAQAPPDAAWRCGRCGQGHGAWAVKCPGCGSFNSLEWPAGDATLAASLAEPALMAPSAGARPRSDWGGKP
jgi:HemY protein